MATVTMKQVWDSHPYPNFPCNPQLFSNQCAIRMGVALNGAGVSTASFAGVKCYPNLAHSPRHILRAQELASWIVTQNAIFGSVRRQTRVTSADFLGKQGIVFIKDGWGPGDHIDVWDGVALKGGTADYFSRGREVWFWELP